MKPYLLFILSALVFLGFVLDGNVLADDLGGQEHNHNSSFSLFSLVRPLGIATLSFVSVTFLTGLFRRKLRRRFLKVHLVLAIISIILGFSHGILVFVLYN